MRPHRGPPFQGTQGPLWFPQRPGVKRKLLEFQERERTESGDGGLEGWERGKGGSPAVTSPPSLDAAPSILCPGLAGRLRRRGAHDWARGAGRSTVDPGDTSTTTNPVTQTLTGSRIQAASKGLLCRDRTVRLSETGTWDSLPKGCFRQPSQLRVWPRHSLMDSPSSAVAPADTPKPLEWRCVLKPKHTHTYTDKLLIYTPPHSPLLQIIFSQVTIP